MSTTTNNFLRSEDVSLRFFTTGNKEIVLNHVNFTVKENATTGADEICGKKNSDPFSVFNFWDVDFDGEMLDTLLIDEFLANTIAKQNNTGENPAVATFRVVTKKGVASNYVFTGIVRKPTSLSASGRSDPFKNSTGFTATAMKKT